MDSTPRFVARALLLVALYLAFIVVFLVLNISDRVAYAFLAGVLVAVVTGRVWRWSRVPGGYD